MPTEAGAAPTTAKTRRKRRRFVIAILLVLLLGSTAAAWGWWWFRRPRPPAPPEIALEDVDPQLAEAIQAARAKVIENPKAAEAWGGLGKLLRISNYREQAGVCFARAEELSPDNVRWPYLRGEALLLSDPEAGLPHLRRAVEIYEKVSKPETVAPWLRLAEVLLALGRYDEAEVPLRRAQELDPDDASVRLNLGLLAYFRDDLEESRSQLLRCLDNPCTEKKANIHLAMIAERLGESTEAANRSRRAENLPADRAWPDAFLLECLRLAKGKQARFQYVEQLEALGRHREAVEVLQEMIDGQPDYRAYVGLGTNLALLGDFPRAEQALRAAIDLTPDNTRACYLLSRLLYVRAELMWSKDSDRAKAEALFGEAAKYAREALARKPDHAQAHMFLGMSLKHLGQRSKALASLRMAVRCGPELPDPHLHLGQLLAEDGQLAEARVQLEKAAELADPKDKRAREALKRLDANEKEER